MSDDRSIEIHQTPAPAPTEGTALGVISMMLGVGGTIPGLGIILAILGIVLGNTAKNRGKRTGNSVGATLGIIGVVVSSFTLVVAVILLFLAGGLIGSMLNGPHLR